MVKKKETQEKPKPQEIEEVKEAVVGEPTQEEVPQEEVPQEVPEAAPQEEPQDEELTEEKAKAYFNNIAAVLGDLTRRIERIEHHLRIDFD